MMNQWQLSGTMNSSISNQNWLEVNSLLRQNAELMAITRVNIYLQPKECKIKGRDVFSKLRRVWDSLVSGLTRLRDGKSRVWVKVGTRYIFLLQSDDFSGMANIAPPCHWDGRNYSLSLLKDRGNLRIFLSKWLCYVYIVKHVFYKARYTEYFLPKLCCLQRARMCVFVREREREREREWERTMLLLSSVNLKSPLSSKVCGR